MSRVFALRLLVASLVLAALLCGRLAIASAASVEDMLSGGLVPSALPGLLEPITSAGRNGWDCKPERAAEADRWHNAHLPAPPDHS